MGFFLLFTQSGFTTEFISHYFNIETTFATISLSTRRRTSPH